MRLLIIEVGWLDIELTLNLLLEFPTLLGFSLLVLLNKQLHALLDVVLLLLFSDH